MQNIINYIFICLVLISVNNSQGLLVIFWLDNVLRCLILPEHEKI